MRRLLPVLLVAAGLVLAGCGGSDDAETTQAHVYFLRDGKVWPVSREVESERVEAATLEALFEGPTSDEEEALETTTAIPGGGPTVTIEDGVARLQPAGNYTAAALAQIVYTLTQFDTIDAVEVDKPYMRADFEEQTPAILVEDPLPFAEVTSPLTATGTANTFEATFHYEVYDADGNMVDENFVTATSGTGTRGTFEFTTGDFDSIGKLVVFEPSAEDGSKTKLVEIPLTS